MTHSFQHFFWNRLCRMLRKNMVKRSATVVKNISNLRFVDDIAAVAEEG